MYVHGEGVGKSAVPQRRSYYARVSSTTAPDRRHNDEVSTQRDVCGSLRTKSRICKDGKDNGGKAFVSAPFFHRGCYTTKQRHKDLSGQRNLMHLSRKYGHKNICFGLILSILRITTATYASTRLGYPFFLLRPSLTSSPPCPDLSTVAMVCPWVPRVVSTFSVERRAVRRLPPGHRHGAVSHSGAIQRAAPDGLKLFMLHVWDKRGPVGHPSFNRRVPQSGSGSLITDRHQSKAGDDHPYLRETEIRLDLQARLIVPRPETIGSSARVPFCLANHRPWA
jgi:hypothetical protein